MAFALKSQVLVSRHYALVFRWRVQVGQRSAAKPVMASAESKPCRVLGMDHIVLKVPNPTESVEWYEKVLGLEPVRLSEWKQGNVPFPSARLTPSFLIDFFPQKHSDEEGELTYHQAITPR